MKLELEQHRWEEFIQACKMGYGGQFEQGCDDDADVFEYGAFGVEDGDMYADGDDF
jgi:hypothetical protein